MLYPKLRCASEYSDKNFFVVPIINFFMLNPMIEKYFFKYFILANKNWKICECLGKKLKIIPKIYQILTLGTLNDSSQ